MSARKTPGRKAIDGITGATARVNVVLTEEHRRRLEQLAPNGYSAWIRRAIDNAWKEQPKCTSRVTS